MFILYIDFYLLSENELSYNEYITFAVELLKVINSAKKQQQQQHEKNNIQYTQISHASVSILCIIIYLCNWNKNVLYVLLITYQSDLDLKFAMVFG